jgi:voltage-gated potassium channel
MVSENSFPFLGKSMDSLVRRLVVFGFLLIAIMLIAATGFMATEELSFSDALYFGIVTITTVGYGDIYPKTGAGKLLAVVLILAGVGTFMGVVANATELLLFRREQRERMEKLNLIIGVFFSELGTELLSRFTRVTPKLGVFQKDLEVGETWTQQTFSACHGRLKEEYFEVSIAKSDWPEWFRFLEPKGDFLLRLLENPSLLEHEAFSDLLRATFHLREELFHRKHWERLSEKDAAHLAGDAQRAYVLLVHQWLDYMRHLSESYPYLFSLATRRNPFKEGASVELQ